MSVSLLQTPLVYSFSLPYQFVWQTPPLSYKNNLEKDGTNKQINHNSCNNLHPGEDRFSSVAPACYKCGGKTRDNPPVQRLTSSPPSSCLAKPGNCFENCCFFNLCWPWLPEISRYKHQDYFHSWPQFFLSIQILKSQIPGELCPQAFVLLMPTMAPGPDMA